MTGVKIFKIEQKFDSIEDLYRYLIKNVELVGELIGIQIQKRMQKNPKNDSFLRFFKSDLGSVRTHTSCGIAGGMGASRTRKIARKIPNFSASSKPLKDRPFCITGREKTTERNILFFASKSEFVECLGELIVLARVFDIDIIVFFLPKITQTYLDSINWLQKICNEDTQFIVGEVDFVFQPKSIN